MKKISRMLAVGGFLILVLLIYGQETPTEEWMVRYNGPGNTKDWANAMTTDSFGNVYVAGYSEGTWSESDLLVVAYNPDGTQRWEAQYRGPGNNSNYARAITLGPSGNIYVTGGSAVSSTDMDYVTIAYDSDGTELWVRRYDGGFNLWDMGVAIATDSFGRVYVTGASETNAYPWEAMGIATVAYDSDGTELWDAWHIGCSHHFDSGTAIATDSSADVVYVTGHSYYPGGLFYITLAYHGSTGTKLWDAVYGGKVADIAVDSQGNVYVTGTSGDYFNSDYATVAYDNSGTELWVREYNGPGDGKDVAKALAMDSTGNIYVTGTSDGIGTSSDYATLAYDSDGNLLWVRRYDGPSNDRDEAYAITTDPAGNVHVTGWSTGAGYSSDCTTLAYRPNGDRMGIAVYEGIEGWSNGGDAIATDSAGNVYVTGDCWFFDTHNTDLVTIKYSFGNTPPGENVVTEPVDPDTGEAPVTLMFDEVTVGGETTLAISDIGPPPPTGFKLGNPETYYEIETTAEYSGVITICIDYSGIEVGDEDNLQFSHYVNGTWEELPIISHDKDSDIICGQVTSLSIFAIFESMTLEDLIEVIQTSSIIEGIQTSLVEKLRSAQESLELGNIKAAKNKIKAFQMEVLALNNTMIPNDSADEWLEISEVVMDRM